jgi:dTDP-4-amino-4,6-dideoxygalactose transaminase
MATGSISPFSPISTTTIAASDVSASGTVAAGDALLVYNATAATAFVALGGVASTASTPIPPGGRQLFASNPFITTVSVVLASGAGNVYVTAGSGTAY